MRWVIEHSWLQLNKAVAARARRFMVGLGFSAMVLWLGLIGAVLCL